MSNKNKSIILELGNSNTQETLSLNYHVRQNAASEIWLNCLQQAIPTGFSENDRFCNLPNHPRSDITYLIQNLKKIIQQINQLEPERKIPNLDESDLKNSLNYLHLNFAHSHLVEKTIHSGNLNLMRDFNSTIHAIEDNMGSRSQFFQDLKILPARLVMTFNNSFKVDIPADCYKDYAIMYSFGTAYINYSQVGKQIFEMYLNQDDQLADEHIQPARYFSADTFFWFGPNLGHSFEMTIKKNLHTWFKQRENRFDSLGLKWSDPRLSLGQVAVADLTEKFDQTYKIIEFQNKLSKFDFIKKIEIES